MDQNSDDLVIPVIGEELHADAVPVVTGGVRVTKRVESHEEILQQELRKGRVEVKRIKTNRVVDGPQSVRQSGKTLIISVVSEQLRIEKQWVVTEEIHVTQLEEVEQFEQAVTVNREAAQVERLDETGQPVTQVDLPVDQPKRFVLGRDPVVSGERKTVTEAETEREVLRRPRSMLKKRS